jgi:glycosyltransferase involved in cell wall biosynthesis
MRYVYKLWSATLAAIRAEHRRAPFDLLHAFWANEPGLLAVLAGRMLKVPVVVSVAGGELVALREIGYGGQLKWSERTIVRWATRRANRVTVGSEYLRRIAARWRSDVELLPLGVDTRRFAPSPRNTIRQPLNILNVGSLVPVKDQRQLLRAFARLETRNARLDIVGAGALDRELRQEADALRISDRVAFCGEIPHETLAQKYRAADLFVQSSRHEAQGMAVLEAAASGTAIAATQVGAAPELADAGAAVAASGFSVDELAATIERGLVTRERLGCRARDVVECKYRSEATWHKWTELYQQALLA